MIKSFAFAIAKRTGMDDRFNVGTGPGKTWWNKFSKRHVKSISLRKPDKLDRGRSSMANLTTMRRHFDTLKTVLMENGIFNEPDLEL